LETYPSLARGEGPWGFILPMAIALSVTALPVLGAILREMGLVHQPIGQWSLGLAAINDAVLWLMVSGILAGTGAGHVGILDMPPLLTLGAGLLYLAGMWVGVRPLLARVFQGERAGHHAESGVLVAVTAFAVLSAVATEVLGLHYLLGAFVAGAVLPGPIRALVLERIEHVTVLLLTPFFFLSIGLRVTLDFSSHAFVGVFILATVAAIAGKFVGTALPARGQGLSWRESLALGALMQSKGMMELAVLSIFVGAGLMSDTVFSALTAMTLVTTTLAMPLTRLILSVAGAGRPCLDTLPEDA
jgi:Kef-type K+ transport system membrane component KefB